MLAIFHRRLCDGCFRTPSASPTGKRRVDDVVGMCVCAHHASTISSQSRLARCARRTVGPLRGYADLERAMTNTRMLGWEPVIGAHVLERDTYLAGTDESRRGDLNTFVADDSIDAIWCIRGGYGAMRLLNSLDYSAWRDHPKVLIGYSDITALHAAIGPRADLVTYHGPTARAELTEFSRASLAPRSSERSGAFPSPRATGDTCAAAATGRLVGGNLALLAALVGTPYAPHLDGTILVLEDVNESVYRLDRMLTQLRLSGALDRVAGIAFGHFTEIPEDRSNEDRPLADLLDEVADRSAAFPASLKFPSATSPINGRFHSARPPMLDADAKTLIMITASHDIVMKTAAELIAEAKARIKRGHAARGAGRCRARGEAITFLDVRDLHEVNLGKIPGTVHISRGNLETKIEARCRATRTSSSTAHREIVRRSPPIACRRWATRTSRRWPPAFAVGPRPAATSNESCRCSTHCLPILTSRDSRGVSPSVRGDRSNPKACARYAAIALVLRPSARRRTRAVDDQARRGRARSMERTHRVSGRPDGSGRSRSRADRDS